VVKEPLHNVRGWAIRAIRSLFLMNPESLNLLARWTAMLDQASPRT
jgi:hypothetical protein